MKAKRPRLTRLFPARLIAALRRGVAPTGNGPHSAQSGPKERRDAARPPGRLLARALDERRLA